MKIEREILLSKESKQLFIIENFDIIHFITKKIIKSNENVISSIERDLIRTQELQKNAQS